MTTFMPSENGVLARVRSIPMLPPVTIIVSPNNLRSKVGPLILLIVFSADAYNSHRYNLKEYRQLNDLASLIFRCFN